MVGLTVMSQTGKR